MKIKIFAAILVFLGLLLAVSVIPVNPLYNVNWALFSSVVIGLAMLAFFRCFEKSAVTSKEIALISTMAALAAVSRIPFAAIMSVQPTTFIVMITGYVFGAQTGFMVGAIAALVSNFFLGQGPWTPWQMYCWGLCGVSAALLAGRQKGFKLSTFIILAGFWGYLFGWIMNIWHWVGFVYPLTLETFIATYLASFTFDTFHAVGNVIFTVLLGKSFYRALNRFKNKFSIIYIDC
ncbi:ECF transporter S component [Desulfoscipio geothermicus]|uniref:Energy-coupling factor transport system substrate-specific component n=1 Tax=Desulfoscipio geothermicus DSM 3669 TaxID=1121426 RepID=A0A1I6D6V2_9FIRM|nr:ECF transporter S component [Desulfoscipio geothermicus]SFR01196.1 energy-coupling factor transport system substrate-specific component [Desulfoscipio geothermicus DSM 3669]